jgi:hypothetical protein
MADEPTGKPGEGTPTSQATAGDPTAGSDAEFSPKQQAKLNEILARKEKDWLKSHKEDFDKAKLADQLIAKQKEREDAEKSELQKLTDKIAELEGRANKATEYEATLNEILAIKLESIPEDKRGMLDELPTVSAKLKWIEKYGHAIFGTAPSVSGPGGGKPPERKTDPLEEEAAKKIEMWEGDKIRRMPKEEGDKYRASKIAQYVGELKRRRGIA